MKKKIHYLDEQELSDHIKRYDESGPNRIDQHILSPTDYSWNHFFHEKEVDVDYFNIVWEQEMVNGFSKFKIAEIKNDIIFIDYVGKFAQYEKLYSLRDIMKKSKILNVDIFNDEPFGKYVKRLYKLKMLLDE